MPLISQISFLILFQKIQVKLTPFSDAFWDQLHQCDREHRVALQEKMIEDKNERELEAIFRMNISPPGTL